jgi:C1A family cysteine protease
MPAKRKISKRLRKQPRRILNCKLSPETERDWSFGNAVNAGVLRAAAIPASKDLRTTWWKIGDQGSTGSCVGWAAADSLLRWHFVKAGRISNSEKLSVRFAWMASKESDEFVTPPTTFIEADGTSLKAALDVARKYGAVKENVLPFGTGKLYPGETEDFYALAAQLKIVSYFNLGNNLTQWRKWIATQGPVLTRLTCDDTWMECGSSGQLATYHPETADGGHAVTLVGYTPTHFIVRNSWGTSLWGDKGFGYATNSYASDAFTEAYGITV